MDPRKPALAAVVLLLALAVVPALPVQAQGEHYTITEEVGELIVNKDGSADVKYDLRIRVRSHGRPVDSIKIHMPNRLFDHDSVSVTLISAKIKGRTISNITFPDDETSFVVHFNLEERLQPSNEYTLLTIARNPVMVFNDPDKSDRAMVEFTPTWFKSSDVQRLVTSIQLPPGYQDLGNTDADGNPEHHILDDRLVFNWTDEDGLGPGEKSTHSVSFLSSAVDRVYDRFWDLEIYNYRYHFLALVIVLIALVAVALALRARRLPYERPEARVEAKGARKGLSPVEAAAALDLSDKRIAQMILVELVMNNELEVMESSPFRGRPVPEMTPRGDCAAMISSLDPDGLVDAKEAKRLVRDIRRRVKVALEGYDGPETRVYYRRVSRTRWKQFGTKTVKKGRSPRPELDVLEDTEPTAEVVQWLMIEDGALKRFKESKGLKVPKWYKWKVGI